MKPKHRLDLNSIKVSPDREEALPRPPRPKRKALVQEHAEEEHPLACPRCGSHKSRVITVWDYRQTLGVRKRRRVCLGCGKRFTTTARERVDPDSQA